ncbi:cortical patch protein [Colletotrichum truncatum]|uniref:Cortical patch protein n=1 Tax=Colletotrichum truncatum TaxID=5467 RepID=A0ACC3YZM6_COLTU
MAKQAGLSLASIFLLSGSIVLLLFVILAGVRDTAPLNNTYFLEGDTSGITGARNGLTRWTYFYYCNDENTGCWGPWPAPAFGWAWGRDAANVPSGLAGGHGGGTTSTEYFYLWRFGWVMYLIALFFMVVAWFGSFLACCGRLGSAIAFLVSASALFFLTVAVSLMTYVLFFPSPLPKCLTKVNNANCFSPAAQLSSRPATHSTQQAAKLLSVLTPSASAGVPGPPCFLLPSSSASVSAARSRAAVASPDSAASAACVAAGPLTSTRAVVLRRTTRKTNVLYRRNLLATTSCSSK